MKCQKCENIHKDPNTNILQCFTCGTVYEESQIVEDMAFDDERRAVGTLVNGSTGQYYWRGGRNTLSKIADNSKLRLSETYKEIEKYAKILTIPKNVVDVAKRCYNLALDNKFTQGRKKNHMIGAILYLACRKSNTIHLLIDFSEVLRVNIFKLGTLYIQLVKILKCEIKIIDPSLFIHRYCIKFNFGNKSKEVVTTALKILQFMKRDWITTGRRPAGICGACILISARLNQLNVDINDIAKVVHVSSKTILNRIEEFSLTRVANMTMEEFKSFKEADFYPGADPPAFLKNLRQNNDEDKKDDEEKKDVEDKKDEESDDDKQIENGQVIQSNNEGKEPKKIKKISYDDNIELDEKNKMNSDELYFKKNVENMDLFLKNQNTSYNNINIISNDSLKFLPPKNNDNLNLNLNKSNNSLSLKLRPSSSRIRNNSMKMEGGIEEKLSNIPENEEYKYIYSKEEYGLRKQFWDIMFKDWMEQQKEKQEKEEKEKKIKPKEPRKRNKKMIFKSNDIVLTPYEAIKRSNKFGPKINHGYIKSIFSKRT